MSADIRREYDKTQEEINNMISKEDDPGKRALLMVLNSMNRSMEANTEATMATTMALNEHITQFTHHTTSFAAHAKAEEALVNKGKGAWWALAWALGIAQMVGGYILVDTRSSLVSLNEHVSLHSVVGAKIQHRLDTIEKFVDKVIMPNGNGK